MLKFTLRRHPWQRPGDQLRAARIAPAVIVGVNPSLPPLCRVMFVRNGSDSAAGRHRRGHSPLLSTPPTERAKTSPFAHRDPAIRDILARHLRATYIETRDIDKSDKR